MKYYAIMDDGILYLKDTPFGDNIPYISQNELKNNEFLWGNGNIFYDKDLKKFKVKIDSKWFHIDIISEEGKSIDTEINIIDVFRLPN